MAGLIGPEFLRVVLPGALPSAFVDVRYGLGIMWLTLVVTKPVLASAGISYMAMNARELMLVDVVAFAILIYAALGKLADRILLVEDGRVALYIPKDLPRPRRRGDPAAPPRSMVTSWTACCAASDSPAASPAHTSGCTAHF